MLKRQRSRRARALMDLEEDEREEAVALASLPVQTLPATRWYECLAMLAVPVTAVLLCGSRAPGSIGLVTLMAGLCLLFLPTRLRLPLALTLAMGAMAVVPWAGLLPVGEGSLPAWRVSLRDDYGLALPGTRSPQPWLTLQGCLLLGVGTLWLAYCVGRGFAERERRFLIQALAVVAAGTAMAAIWFHMKEAQPALWTGSGAQTYYGPFTNRNNFSGLLAPAAVLAFAAAYDGLRRRDQTWVLYAVCLLPIFAGLLYNTSRMGVVLFFGGLGGWMMSGALGTSSAKRFALSTTVLLLLAVVFLIYGRNIVERFTGQGGLVTTLTSDGRVHIFQQTAKLLMEAPWLGIGLGNFEGVYAMHKEVADTSWITRTLHPESDWLWLAVEGGLLTLVAAGVTGWLVYQQMGSWKRADGHGRHDRRLRAAAGVAVLLLVTQGLVDTPLHTVGLATFGALLAGLALRPSRRAFGEPRVPLLRYAGSGYCLVCGSLWLLVGLGDALLPGNFTADMYLKRARALSVQGNYADAMLAVDKVIATSPLEWEAYYMRASMNLQMGRPHQSALDDFARARALEPHFPEICMQEALIWLDHSPPLAVPALREAMRRDPRNAAANYRRMLGQIGLHPELRLPLRHLATDANLRLAYLESASGGDFQEGLQELLDHHPSLENFTPEQKLALFELWYGRGERSTLLRELKGNAVWRTQGWIVLARDYAAAGNFEEACKLAFQYLREANLPDLPGTKDVGQLNRQFLSNPNDPLRGLALYKAQRMENQRADALRTLREVVRLPNAPAAAQLEYASRLAEQGDFSRAWEAIQAYRKRIIKA